MLQKLFVSLITIISTVMFAEKPAYLINQIPVSLKSNAHTVYREIKYNIEIKSENAATVKVSEVRSILNKNGEKNVIFIESYNPMNKITALRGWVYDENGKRIRSVSNEDAYDWSNMGYSLYDENRIRILDPKCLTYPMTVKYDYELSLKQTLFLPSLSLNDYNTSYEHVEFIITTPSNIGIKYKEYNLPLVCTKTSADNKNTYTWKLTNIEAKTNEPFSPHFVPNSPTILVVPNNFMVEESKGSTANWKEFGKWATTLLADKDKLPEATVAKIKELTKGITNDIDKVKAVYEFMQKKTRYVSIQIGIGGWQPFGAEVVDKNSYGDCKALSNYTRALLSAAGVKSHYVLVKAGDTAGEIDTSFVGSQFNHAIVCVPLAKDTIWLEATDQLLPCGFNSDFTDDRSVLLVDNENSKIVHTRVYSMNENCINRKAIVNLNSDKSGLATIQTSYKGLSYGDKRQVFVADDNVKKRMITESINIPSFTLKNFSLEEKRAYTPEINENLSVELTNYVTSLNGSIDLLPLNLMNKLSNIPEKVRNRKNKVSIRRSYLENDTITYQLPDNYNITSVPEIVSINTIFGEYNAAVTVKDKQATYIRRFSLLKGIHPAAEYVNFREYLEKVKTNDDVMLGIQKL